MSWFQSIANKIKKGIAAAASSVRAAMQKTVKILTSATSASNVKKNFFTFLSQATCLAKRLARRLSIAIRRAVAWVKAHPYKTFFIVLAIILAIVLPPVLLHVIGFTAGGIAAGSLAAAIQSSIGSVAAGSLFAILTSAMMGGYGVPIVIGAIAGIYASVVAAWAFWNQGSGGDDVGSDKGDKED